MSLQFFDETIDGGLVAPRGMLTTVTELAAQAGSKLDLADERRDFGSSGTKDRQRSTKSAYLVSEPFRLLCGILRMIGFVSDSFEASQTPRCHRKGPRAGLVP